MALRSRGVVESEASRLGVAEPYNILIYVCVSARLRACVYYGGLCVCVCACVLACVSACVCVCIMVDFGEVPYLWEVMCHASGTWL